MSSTRRDFLAGGLYGLQGVLRAQSRRTPNILVVMSDQESALLPGPANLPNRSKLQARGTTFQHAFCNTPQCSPARSSLLTGLEPHHTGVLTNVDSTSLGKALPPETPTIGSVLKAAGYETGYFGKWHLGVGDDNPLRHGFDDYRDGKDDAVAAHAADWIRGRKTPWLAWVSLFNPHEIYDFKATAQARIRGGVRPPASGLDNLKGKPAEQRAYMDEDQGRPTLRYTAEDWVRYRSYYLDLVEKVDLHLGTVVGAVDRLEQTIILYTSDHGDALGEHGMPFKGPMMYEELVRIPMVMAGPGIGGGIVRPELMTQADVAPTLVSAAGVRWPSRLDGQDLLGKKPARDAVFLEYYAKQKRVNPIRTIRTERWKLNWYDSGRKELYDLKRDPHETVNVAGETEVLTFQSNLEKRINAWRAPNAGVKGED